MGRVEKFEHQNMACWRAELEEAPVELTEERRPAPYGGGEYTRVLRRWRGRHRLSLGGAEYDVDESLLTDCGPGLGISVAYTPHRAEPFPEEMRQAGRRRVAEAAARRMVQMGIW